MKRFLILTLSLILTQNLWSQTIHPSHKIWDAAHDRFMDGGAGKPVASPNPGEASLAAALEKGANSLNALSLKLPEQKILSKAQQPLTLHFTTPGEYHYQIVYDGLVINGMNIVEEGGLQTTVELSPGDYRVQGYARLSQGDEPERLYIFGRDNLDMLSQTNLVFDGANVVSPTLKVIDLNGVERDISQIEYKTFNATLTHLPTLGWETRSFFVEVTDNGPLPLLDAEMEENFYLEVVGLAPLEEKASMRFAEFGFRMQAGGALSFENDWRNYKPITWQYQAMNSPNTHINAQYLVVGPASSTVVFNAAVLAPGYQLEAPFKVTILAMPQDVPYPGTWEHRQYLRRFRIEAHDEDPQKTRILQTGRFKVLDQEHMAFMELNANDAEELYTTTSNVVTLGDVMTFPNFRFFSSYITFSLGLYSSFGTGLFMDSWQSGVQTPNLSFTLFNEDTQEITLEGGVDELDVFGDGFTIAENRFSFAMNFESRFNGEAVDGSYKAAFSISDGDDTPPYIYHMYVEQGAKRSPVITGPARLVLEMDDFRAVSGVSLEIDAGDGWTSVDLDRERDVFTGNLPNLQPGTFGNLRIKAWDNANHNFELTMDRTLRWGYFYVIPWVVNNSQWSSRIAIANSSNQAVMTWLEALTGTGQTQTREVEIPANSVYAVESSQLFPNLSGYRLKINSNSKNLHSSFLTFNLEESSGGRSPSQTTAQFSEDLTARLLFPYLPGDQLPAIVICAPGRDSQGGPLSAATPVSITLTKSDGSVLAEKTITLIGSQPMALMVETLFQGQSLPQHGTIEARAHNGTHLAGTTFTFNSQREPSMAGGLSHPHEPANGQIIPWVVSNEQWSSRIAVYNRDSQTHNITFNAVAQDGQTLTATHAIEGNSVMAWDAGELFPNLSGYSMSLETEQGSRVFASFLTFNLEAQSGGQSPSQTTGVLSREQSSDLIFSYLPTGEIPAITISAPEGVGQTEVTLAVYGSEGPLGEETIQLTHNRPYAVLISDLFQNITLPQHIAIRATSTKGTALAGTAFIFNNRREPSMAKASMVP